MHDFFTDFEKMTEEEQDTIINLANRRGVPVPREVQLIVDQRRIAAMSAVGWGDVRGFELGSAPVDNAQVVAELAAIGATAAEASPVHVDESVNPVQVNQGLQIVEEEPMHSEAEQELSNQSPTPVVEAAPVESQVQTDAVQRIEEQHEVEEKLRLWDRTHIEDPLVTWARNPVREGSSGAGIKLPAVSRSGIEKIINVLRENGVREEDITEEMAASLDHGSTLLLEHPRLGNIKGDFANHIEYKGRKLNSDEVRLSVNGGGVVSGRTAVELAMRRRNRGSSKHVACWASGFWLTFVPASDSDIYEIHQRMGNKAAEFGYETYGAAFERMSGLMQETLLDFALAHLDTTSLAPELSNPQSIRGLLSKLDIPIVLAGFASTLYSNGFNYSRRCIADLAKCSHQVTGNMNILEMIQVDRNRLTEPMLRHMSERRHGSHTLESLAAYKQELAKSAPSKRVVVSEGTEQEMVINFRIATADDYFRESNEWVSEVGATVLKLTTEATTPAAKNKMYQDAMMMSYLRNYASWIESIEFDQTVIEDRATIEDTLSRLSNDNEFIEALVRGKDEFHNASIISVVGIPTYTCPACKKPQPGMTENKGMSNFIALEVVELFFDLVNLRFLKALQVVS